MLEEKEVQISTDEKHGMRIFRDDYFSLQVKLDNEGRVQAFELEYRKGQVKAALIWTQDQGMQFPGDEQAGDPAGQDDEHGFNVVVVEREFEQRSARIDLGIASFVLEMLRMYREGELAEDPNPGR